MCDDDDDVIITTTAPQPQQWQEPASITAACSGRCGRHPLLV